MWNLKKMKQLRAKLWITLLIVWSTACSSPTGPTPPELTHPNELILNDLVQCNAEFRGLGHIDIFWRSRIYITTANGALGIVACAANKGADYMQCDQRWVHGASRVGLKEVASHEVCHIAGHMDEPPLACMVPAWEKCN
jgi:hypothetical protein